jgi:hypothetical protein
MSANFSDANNIINVSALAIFQKAGITDRFIDFGNLTQVSGNAGIKTIEAFFSVNGFLQLAKKVVTSVTPVFTITADEFPVSNLALLYGASTPKTSLLQSLVASATLTVTNAAPGDVVRLPVENPTIISITIAATPLVIGVDYDLLGGSTKASSVRFRYGSSLVTGAASAVITYSAPAITATAFPRIWKEDTFNSMNVSGYCEITFTDAFSTFFNHRITGNCFLSPSKYPDYKPDAFCSAEFTLSFVGPGNMYKVEN